MAVEGFVACRSDRVQKKESLKPQAHIWNHVGWLDYVNRMPRVLLHVVNRGPDFEQG